MRLSFAFTSVSLSFFLISWGVTAHRSITKIAENHLTPKASVAIKIILNGEEMPLVSTFGDEIRTDPAYRNTGSWHYINPPQNLNFNEFVTYLKSDTTANVYNALLKMTAQLKDGKSSPQEKLFALKMVIHLVGDLHQPMHVSRAEDQGGNKIKLRFN